jgi:alginate O-acetyltransferase complex protein AlgI
VVLSSILFIFVFLPVSLLLYHGLTRLPVLDEQVRSAIGKAILLVLSIVFYACGSFYYLPIICVWVLANYGFALWMQRRLDRQGALADAQGDTRGDSRTDIQEGNQGDSRQGAREGARGDARGNPPENPPKSANRSILIVAIIFDVAALMVIRQLAAITGFFGGPDGDWLSANGWAPALGISFLTFAVISYLIDVYRQTVRASRNLLQVSLWLLFFPKVIQGPITRYGEFWEGEGLRKPTLDNFSYGAQRFVFGLAKKVLIADILGVTVDRIFLMQAGGIDIPTAWLGIILFGLQLFFDFSGYCDMAIGIGAMFGFRLPENFDYPYMARSVGDFWRRWHMTLCRWLRDYLYIPLGGSRHGNVYLNLILVFLVSGLWHGFLWHYLLWGAWFAFFMCVERFFSLRAKKRAVAQGVEIRRLPRGVGIVLTLLVVFGSWVWFRSTGAWQAIAYFGNLLGIGTSTEQFYQLPYLLNGRTLLVAAVAIFLSTPACKMIAKRCDGRVWFQLLRAVAVPALLAFTIMCVMDSSYSPFIYQQY